MKLVIIIVVIIITFPAWAACPNAELKETMQDCPYSQWAQDLDKKDPVFWEDFQSIAKPIATAVEADATMPALGKLWGKSFNYDELAKAIILAPKLYSALAKTFGVPVFSEIETSAGKRPFAHAGLMHTYGYLFSNLMTPYGYKRSRWVSKDIETGFGLVDSSLSPTPNNGTLLSNLTYFLGTAVFTDKPQTLKLVDSIKDKVSDEIKKWNWSKISRTSIIETPANPELEILHTEFFKFLNPKTPTEQSHLLVYWVENKKDSTAVLITAFPVKSDFVAAAVKSENFGASLEIKTKYNALVERISLANPAIKGSRVLCEEKCISKPLLK